MQLISIIWLLTLNPTGWHVLKIENYLFEKLPFHIPLLRRNFLIKQKTTSLSLSLDGLMDVRRIRSHARRCISSAGRPRDMPIATYYRCRRSATVRRKIRILVEPSRATARSPFLPPSLSRAARGSHCWRVVSPRWACPECHYIATGELLQPIVTITIIARTRKQ